MSKEKQVLEGHMYSLPTSEAGKFQPLHFVKKELIDGELQTVFHGTTNEEVLKVLIHRLNFLNKELPCRENSIAITKLEEALMWLNKRTEDRIERGVENTPWS